MSPHRTQLPADNLLPVWRQFRATRDPRLRTALLLATRFVVKHAAIHLAKHLPSSITPAELEAAATLGLLVAIDTYNPEQQVKFTTYAYHHVRGAILDSVHFLNPLPRSLRRISRTIAHTTHCLEQRLLRPPDDTEIASALGLSLHAYHTTLFQLHSRIEHSLNTASPRESRQPKSPLSALPHLNTRTPYDEAVRRESYAILSSLINALPSLEHQVLTLYYYDQLTFTKIAQLLHFSKTHILQLHANAIEHLRAYLRQRHIPAEDLRIESPPRYPSIRASARH